MGEAVLPPFLGLGRGGAGVVDVERDRGVPSIMSLYG